MFFTSENKEILQLRKTPFMSLMFTYFMRYVANIINLIFVDDGNHFKFYSPVAAATFLSSYKQMPNASACRHHVITLTFDLSTSKRSHGLSVSGAFLLPIFSLLLPSVLDLWVRHRTDRQTDRRTDRQRSSLHNTPTLWGWA